MNYVNINKPSAIDSMFAAGNKLLEFFSLGRGYKNINENVLYFLSLITKQSTVLDIGQHDAEHVNLLIKISKRAKKLIAFEADPDTRRCLAQKIDLFKSDNIIIQQLPNIEPKNSQLNNLLLQKKNEYFFNFYTNTSHEVESKSKNNIDDYCNTHNIKPDFLKIYLRGNVLALLHNFSEMLIKYKPKILLTCEEGMAGRDEILNTFTFLTDLKYTGFFILDSIKIPTINFDFNIYQNPLSILLQRFHI